MAPGWRRIGLKESTYGKEEIGRDAQDDAGLHQAESGINLATIVVFLWSYLVEYKNKITATGLLRTGTAVRALFFSALCSTNIYTLQSLRATYCCVVLFSFLVSPHHVRDVPFVLQL